MIKFDFKTYTKNYINEEDYQELEKKKEEIFEKFKKSNMTGWTRRIDSSLISDIKETAKIVKENFNCLVVIGIGGSFLGSYSFEKMFQKYFGDSHFEVLYAGTTLSNKYLEELMNYLKNKNFCINVISKSGTTMETSITYTFLKELLIRKYGMDNIKERIIITTDKEKGKLREEVKEKGYKSFEIPEDIGGRYSFITPAHLFPLALNFNIEEIVEGYYEGQKLTDIAYEYAMTRYLLFKKNKWIENFCVYEENMSPFTEWLKQLFGETEGKNGVGLFPTSMVHTRDLHSLGQFVQEGNKIIFETFMKVENTNTYLEYNGRDLHEINNIVLDSVVRAHYSGGVPCLEIVLSELDIESVSTLIYFFMMSAAFSGYLFGIEPFNQPGVEVYKNEVRNSLRG